MNRKQSKLLISAETHVSGNNMGHGKADPGEGSMQVVWVPKLGIVFQVERAGVEGIKLRWLLCSHSP